jgi:hypothetical protein
MRAPDERQKIWDNPERLEAWTNAALDAFGVHDDDLPFENLPRKSPAEWWRQEELALAITEARRGHPERLRRLFPAIAEFIHSPPRRRGQRRRPQADPFRHLLLELALDDVRHIRKIWRERFGKSYAPRNGPTALAIAARRHSNRHDTITEAELTSFRSNRHR